MTFLFFSSSDEARRIGDEMGSDRMGRITNGSAQLAVGVTFNRMEG